jgi:hypothetical protein
MIIPVTCVKKENFWCFKITSHENYFYLFTQPTKIIFFPSKFYVRTLHVPLHTWIFFSKNFNILKDIWNEFFYNRCILTCETKDHVPKQLPRASERIVQ